VITAKGWLTRRTGAALVLGIVLLGSQTVVQAKTSSLSKSTLSIEMITSYPSPVTGPGPQQAAAFQAAVQQVNHTGGIQGHPLKGVVCFDNGDANQALACAQQAVADPSVVSIVGQYTNSASPIIDPIFESAGMADTGLFPVGPQDTSCSVCFPISGGALTQVIAEPFLLNKRFGSKHIAIVTAQVASAQALVNSSISVFPKKIKGGTVQGVYIPTSTTDYSPYIAQMKAAGIDGVVLFAGFVIIPVVQTALQLGFNVPFATQGQTIHPATIAALGSALNTMVVACSQTPVTSNAPGIKAFKLAMRRYAPGQVLDPLSEGSYSAAAMFASVARSIKGPITRASFLTAMKKLRNYDSGGIIPRYSTNRPWHGLNGTAPRVFNPEVVACKSNAYGVLTATSGFYTSPS
jgi:branched-chain amino acid transport system substrate-binding protein